MVTTGKVGLGLWHPRMHHSSDAPNSGVCRRGESRQPLRSPTVKRMVISFDAQHKLEDAKAVDTGP